MDGRNVNSIARGLLGCPLQHAGEARRLMVQPTPKMVGMKTRSSSGFHTRSFARAMVGTRNHRARSRRLSRARCALRPASVAPGRWQPPAGPCRWPHQFVKAFHFISPHCPVATSRRRPANRPSWPARCRHAAGSPGSYHTPETSESRARAAVPGCCEDYNSGRTSGQRHALLLEPR